MRDRKASYGEMISTISDIVMRHATIVTMASVASLTTGEKGGLKWIA